MKKDRIMQIAVLDCEENARRELAERIRRILAETGIPHRISLYGSGQALLSAAKAGFRCHILFSEAETEDCGIMEPASLLRSMEKAIIDSDLGIMPENNGEIIRIGIPPLTEERRKQLAKQCKGEAENAKVSVRNARREGVDKLKKAVKDGLPEDEQKNGEEKLQKLHDKYIKTIDELFAAKEKEIMTV